MVVDLVKLIINGKEVEAPVGSTILQAAEMAGVEIPRLCYDKDLSPLGACRLCVVEVKGNRLLPAACVTPVYQGMEQLAQGSFNTAFLKIAYGRDVNPQLLEEELQNWSQVSQQQLYVDFTACNNYDVSQQVGDIKMPVLILVGDQDKMTPIKSSQYLQEKIGGSVLQIVPGAGHHLMLEKPAETISAISGFLKASFSRQD